ncbi:MAG: hypothetical protein JWQ01_291 [Massilia sp.]|jgi:hypothetical protein|nr:hypothetical protein [Massilia sp.]
MDIGKQALLFVLKSFVFTVVWFFTWFVVLHPVSEIRRQQASAIDIETKQQADAYTQQLNEAGRQLAEIAAQQKRMGALLSQYEQQAARYDAVLQKWETQTKIRK